MRRTILVIGSGQVARAISVPLSDNGHTVLLVPARPQDELPQSKFHALQSPNVRPHERVTILPRWKAKGQSINNQLCRNHQLLVVGVNSIGLPRAADLIQFLSPHPEVPILLLTKGLAISGQKLQIFPIMFKDMLSERLLRNPVLFLGGPYVAGELAGRCRTSVVLTGEPKAADQVSGLLETSYLNVTFDSDLRGVSLCAAFKNIYALAVGVAIGESCPTPEAERGLILRNPAAAIFTQAIKEMAQIVAFLGGSTRSVLSLAGVGDLHVTCGTGRNHRAGVLLGHGLSLDEIESMYMPGETIEGANLAKAVRPFMDHLFDTGYLRRIEFPLLSFILEVTTSAMEKRSLPWNCFYQATTA